MRDALTDGQDAVSMIHKSWLPQPLLVDIGHRAAELLDLEGGATATNPGPALRPPHFARPPIPPDLAGAETRSWPTSPPHPHPLSTPAVTGGGQQATRPVRGRWRLIGVALAVVAALTAAPLLITQMLTDSHGSTASRGTSTPTAATFDAKVQQAATKAMSGRKGSVVALDPATGRILAVAGKSSATTTPSPSPLPAGLNRQALEGATRTTYPPGAVFELVTVAAALESDLYGSVDQATGTPNPWIIPSTTVKMQDHNNNCENASLRLAMRYRCNSVFGKAAVDLGAEALRKQAELFGFNAPLLTTPLLATSARFPTGTTGAQTALCGVGQFDVTASPLQLAVIAAAIANNGTLLRPYVLTQGNDAARKGKRVMSAATAAGLKALMTDSVQAGSASSAAISGVHVGASTGTFQSLGEDTGSGDNGIIKDGNPGTWLVSYAADDRPRVAVAVLLDDDDRDGAGTIAKTIMQAALH
ncbi:penicillin-binding transpeptidase domain-containing protein [Streptomyces mangrovisoli]|uniref:penicillin-binding transpeptidase domain-containing protein n=1 Tax=Streptomyces mangrovisoli TaxID=1428628 RepID=UPI003B8461AD